MGTEKKNILLIDDDKDFVLSTKTFLEGRGYTVDTAHDGTEGWAKIKAGKADLLILDIMMDTDYEGFHVANKMKEDQALKKIPIIIVSGFSQHLKDEMDAAWPWRKAWGTPGSLINFEFILGRDWPGVDQLDNPINLQELAAMIGRVLG